jgi:hypothetical protein
MIRQRSHATSDYNPCLVISRYSARYRVSSEDLLLLQRNYCFPTDACGTLLVGDWEWDTGIKGEGSKTRASITPAEQRVDGRQDGCRNYLEF